jgi:hypothetical protein
MREAIEQASGEKKSSICVVPRVNPVRSMVGLELLRKPRIRDAL